MRLLRVLVLILLAFAPACSPGDDPNAPVQFAVENVPFDGVLADLANHRAMG